MAKDRLPALLVEARPSALLCSDWPGRVAGFGVVAVISLTLANCAQQSQSQRYSSQQAREFGAFASKKYGTASPRMYADDGSPMPKGGGRDHIGRSYRVAGRVYTPHDRPVGAAQVGFASWYGAAFHGRKTANGEIYDRRAFSAAHPTMPLPSYARVTNLRNGASVIVRVNDRGPYHGGRIMDVSERVADALQFKGMGTGRIRVDYLGRAGLGGSDDVRLAQSFRMDGTPAVAAHIPASYGENRAAVAVAMAEPVASARPEQPAVYTPRRAAAAVTPLPEETEPVETPARAAQPAAQPTTTAAHVPIRAPLPPARPFDLNPVRNGLAPGKAAPQRTASLSFAPQATAVSRFQQANPLANLAPARFTPASGKTMQTALKD